MQGRLIHEDNGEFRQAMDLVVPVLAGRAPAQDPGRERDQSDGVVCSTTGSHARVLHAPDIGGQSRTLKTGYVFKGTPRYDWLGGSPVKHRIGKGGLGLLTSSGT